MLTNPYFLAYLGIISLLVWLCFGLRRMHLENVERRKQQVEASKLLTKAQD